MNWQKFLRNPIFEFSILFAIVLLPVFFTGTKSLRISNIFLPLVCGSFWSFITIALNVQQNRQNKNVDTQQFTFSRKFVDLFYIFLLAATFAPNNFDYILWFIAFVHVLSVLAFLIATNSTFAP